MSETAYSLYTVDGATIQSYASGVPNAGKRWDDEQLLTVLMMWCAKTPIQDIALRLQRSFGAIITKLREARFIERCDRISFSHYRTAVRGLVARNLHAEGRLHLTVIDGRVKVLDSKSSKEKSMAKPVETKTFIYGVESKEVTDAKIFAHISELENEIKTLEAIEHKPKKLIARIAELQGFIADLVKVCDERGS